MTSLELSSNSLTGTLPTSLSNCVSLASIEVEENFLVGKFAVGYRHCSNTFSHYQ
jgi:hypothetical protein